MTFIELYGTELDRELGTADRTQRFTTARRKAAINAGQIEFVRRTECLTREASIALSDGVDEYDLEASATDFGWISKQGLSISIDNGTTVRYLEGDDLTFTTIERLNTEQPGWRAWPDGDPRFYYVRVDGGSRYLGLAPAPSISTETVAARVPYVVVPADMSGDADEPFTVAGNPLRSLRFYHRALVYFAAFDLEKLRKDTQREGLFAQLFDAEVMKYLAEQKPRQPRTVRFGTPYRGRVSFARLDPRRYP